MLEANRDALIDKYHVSRVGIFGSVARGSQTPSSDVDVLVEFSKPVGLFLFIDLENFLGSILEKKVDLVTEKALKPLIRDSILHDVVYA